MIASDTNKSSGMELCSTLPNDDLPGLDGLTAKALYAESLGITVATVF
jgi:hypothetical protein